ncbi:hypothetical protein KIN20_000864 [Parelaphostrongylus tenuis]|uniref:Uncharacterized protein n=1 Tax=Parelaphostrongylus tenuis TaxID=148309 RepID=A0AAD5MLA6_PARTN|nr:hypothetical protein KIN20_000864 [Parelaphostrongylus tenuis]
MLNQQVTACQVENPSTLQCLTVDLLSKEIEHSQQCNWHKRPNEFLKAGLYRTDSIAALFKTRPSTPAFRLCQTVQFRRNPSKEMVKYSRQSNGLGSNADDKRLY